MQGRRGGGGGGSWRQREVMAGAGRMEDEEGVGKVGRVALNNVATHSNFRVCACFD